MSKHSGYQPWRGSSFGEGALGSRRLLLVGEAHYLPPEESDFDRETLTQEIVGRVRDRSQPIPFFTKATQLVDPSVTTSAESWTQLWDSIGFYNYIPCLAAQQAGVAPTKEMWQLAPSRFGQVLESLKPLRVLVLCERVWNQMSNGLPEGWTSRPKRPDERVQYLWTSTAGASISATWTNHPSSRGFTITRWRERVIKLLG